MDEPQPAKLKKKPKKAKVKKAEKMASQEKGHQGLSPGTGDWPQNKEEVDRAAKANVDEAKAKVDAAATKVEAEEPGAATNADGMDAETSKAGHQSWIPETRDWH